MATKKTDEGQLKFYKIQRKVLRSKLTHTFNNKDQLELLSASERLREKSILEENFKTLSEYDSIIQPLEFSLDSSEDVCEREIEKCQDYLRKYHDCLSVLS